MSDPELKLHSGSVQKFRLLATPAPQHCLVFQEFSYVPGPVVTTTIPTAALVHSVVQSSAQELLKFVTLLRFRTGKLVHKSGHDYLEKGKHSPKAIFALEKPMRGKIMLPNTYSDPDPQKNGLDHNNESWHVIDLLKLAELVTEGDEQLAVSLPLVGREGKYAGHIVPVRGLLLLGEISHNVGPISATKRLQLPGCQKC